MGQTQLGCHIGTFAVRVQLHTQVTMAGGLHIHRIVFTFVAELRWTAVKAPTFQQVRHVNGQFYINHHVNKKIIWLPVEPQLEPEECIFALRRCNHQTS